MKKYTVNVPLVATAWVDVWAEDEDDAMNIVEDMVSRYEVDLNGYDAEHGGSWWVDECEDQDEEE